MPAQGAVVLTVILHIKSRLPQFLCYLRVLVLSILVVLSSTDNNQMRHLKSSIYREGGVLSFNSLMELALKIMNPKNLKVMHLFLSPWPQLSDPYPYSAGLSLPFVHCSSSRCVDNHVRPSYLQT